MPSPPDGSLGAEPEPTCQWICSSGARLQFKQWDNEDLTLAFDPVSCDTHLLEPLATEVLRLIDASPRSTQAIVDAVEPLLEEADRVDVVALIDSCLQKLQGTGLIERRTH